MEYILKKIKFSESKFGKAISGKGFYIALCLCIVAIGIAGTVVYKQTMKSISVPPAITENADGKVNSSSKTDKNTTKNVGATEEPTGVEPMILPVSGEVINPFSNGELVKSNTTKIWKTHNGVDIASPIGTQVKAMSKGTVTDVGNDPLWGNYVLIDHNNGMQSKYCGLNSALPVKKGDKVSAGTIIGAVSDSAQVEISDPSHLHFEIIQNGNYVDPMALIEPSRK